MRFRTGRSWMASRWAASSTEYYEVSASFWFWAGPSPHHMTRRYHVRQCGGLTTAAQWGGFGLVVCGRSSSAYAPIRGHILQVIEDSSSTKHEKAGRSVSSRAAGLQRVLFPLGSEHTRLCQAKPVGARSQSAELLLASSQTAVVRSATLATTNRSRGCARLLTVLTEGSPSWQSNFRPLPTSRRSRASRLSFRPLRRPARHRRPR
jgi:hypothetical protein